MHRYFVIYKPFQMVSQFVSPYEHVLLGDLDFDFPEGTQAVGRLDEDSEGLLILTNDRTLTKRLLHPDKKHSRSYIVQVERKVEEDTLKKLCSGIDILIKGRGAYHTLPCDVKLIDKPELPDRALPPNSYVNYSWLEFTLIEGKNRQIRKMCRAVRHECRRLVRTKIEDLDIGTMKPGEVREMQQDELFRLLRLNSN